MYIQVSKIGKAITGSVNGKSFGITFNQARYDAMKELEKKALAATTVDDVKAIIEEFLPLTKEDFSDKVMTACPIIYVDPAGRFYLKWKDQILSQRLPGALVERILKSVEEGLDFLPLAKAWLRMLRNPNYTEAKGRLFANYINQKYTDHQAASDFVSKHGFSEEVAADLATTYQTPITMEGLLCSYKVSEELTEKYVLDADGNKKKVSRYVATIDENTGIVSYAAPAHVEDMVFQPAVQGTSGDAFMCVDLQGQGSEGHIIKVGHRHILKDWAMVNCNDNKSCVKGLHIGNLDYIRGYQAGNGKVTHNVFVDPALIGAFTDDGTGAIRAKEYFVHSTLDKVNRSVYHSSEYGKVTDSEYEIWLQDSIAKYGELQEDVATKRKEAHIISDLSDPIKDVAVKG